MDKKCIYTYTNFLKDCELLVSKSQNLINFKWDICEVKDDLFIVN